MPNSRISTKPYLEGLYGQKRTSMFSWKGPVVKRSRDDEDECGSRVSEGPEQTFDALEAQGCSEAQTSSTKVVPHHANISRNLVWAFENGKVSSTQDMMNLVHNNDYSPGFDLVGMLQDYNYDPKWKEYVFANSVMINLLLKQNAELREQNAEMKKQNAQIIQGNVELIKQNEALHAQFEEFKNVEKKTPAAITKLAQQALEGPDSVLARFGVNQLKTQPLIVDQLYTGEQVDLVAVARGFSKVGAKQEQRCQAFLTFLLHQIVPADKTHLYTVADSPDDYLPIPDDAFKALKVVFMGAFGVPLNPDGTISDDVDDMDDAIAAEYQLGTFIRDKLYNYFCNARKSFNKAHSDLGAMGYTPAKSEALRVRKNLGLSLPANLRFDFY